MAGAGILENEWIFERDVDVSSYEPEQDPSEDSQWEDYLELSARGARVFGPGFEANLYLLVIFLNEIF